MKNEPPAIGIIGASGLYQMEEVRDAAEHKIDTHSKAEILKKLKQEKKGRSVNLALSCALDFIPGCNTVVPYGIWIVAGFVMGG